MHELILTSKSPRRRDILREAGYKFHVYPIEVSEILNENLNLPDQISDCAYRKVLAVKESGKLLKSQNVLLLGADTVVVHNSQILGKPKNEQDAINILNQLSGQVHDVITGFCLFDLTTERLILDHDVTQVSFRKLSLQEIETYVRSGDPMDKAGSYGIQGEARKFVDKFSGSLKNVIGLPLEKIEKALEKNDWRIRKES